MTTLHLIRHGKASPAKASYDELDPIGEQQARLLGEHLGRIEQRFDALYCGPLRRQQDTLRLMREGAGAFSARWPQAIELDALAEAPLEAVMRQCLPERMLTDSTLTALIAAIGDGSDQARAKAGFDALLDYSIDLWVRGELARPGLETAQEFSDRVLGGLEQILAREGEHEGRQVAVVTSNGVIGRLVAHASKAADALRLGPGRRYWNSSRTLLALRNGELGVGPSNLVDHLADAALHTFI